MDFLLDLGATFSVLTEAPGPFFSQFTVWMSQTLFFQSFFQLQQGLCAIFFFFYKFLIMLESPSSLLGRDMMSKVQSSVFMNMETTLYN